MRVKRVGDFFKIIRNGVSFSFSWLVLCLMIIGLTNDVKSVEVMLLFKLLGLCLYAVFCFTLFFTDAVIRKKGFIFRLSCFFVTFIPVEIMFFYAMNIFENKGEPVQWSIFGGIVLLFYIGCILLDWIVCKRKGVEYTNLLQAYNERREHESDRSIKEPK